MRPTASFTLHAILAACLAALAASSAAAGGPVIDNEGHAFLTSNLLGGSAAKGGGHQLEVDSWQWGSPNRAYLKYKLSPVFVKSWSTSGDADALPPTGSGQNEMRMEDRAGAGDPKSSTGSPGPGNVFVQSGDVNDSGRTGHSMLGASDRVTVGGGRTEAPPQGQYRTLRPRPVDAPPPRLGALTVLARGIPCRVGARYPSLSFTGKGKTWLLQDVEVADCGAAAGPTEELTFVYGKVTVKGWDPKKKEE